MSKEITPKQLEDMEILSGLGIPMRYISRITLGTEVRVLEMLANKNSAVRDALERGRAKAGTKIAQTAYAMATSGEHPAMTIFMAKVMLGWRETDRLEVTGKDGGPVQVGVLYASMTREEAEQKLTKTLKVIEMLGSKIIAKPGDKET